MINFGLYEKIFILNESHLDINIKRKFESISYVSNISEKLLEYIMQSSKLCIIIPPSKKKYVEDKGLKEFSDFIIDEFVLKKIVIIYGNCHTTVIRQYLNLCPEFTNEYIIYPIKAIQEIKDSSYFELPVFSFCDLLIHQSIQKNNKYGEDYSSDNIIKKVPEACRIVSIPNLYGLPICYFPQCIRDRGLSWRGDSIFFHDSILDNAIEKGFSLKKINKEYHRNDLFSYKYLKEEYNIFIEKVKKRELEWDIKVSDYIINNYKEIQLFYDPNHPTDDFFFYVVKRILDILEIHYCTEYLETVRGKVVHLDDYEIPILTCVKQCFEMKFPDKSMIRKTGKKVYPSIMDYSEYVRQYRLLSWQSKKLNKIRRLYLFIYFIINKMIYKVKA